MSNSTKYYSNLQETSIAKDLGWKQVTGSGARPNYPGDIVSDKWLGECKTHTQPGKRVTFVFSVWDKIEEEALSRFKRPVLFVDDGSQKLERTWVMVSIAARNEDVNTILHEGAKSYSVPAHDDMPHLMKRNNKFLLVLPYLKFKLIIDQLD